MTHVSIVLKIKALLQFQIKDQIYPKESYKEILEIDLLKGQEKWTFGDKVRPLITYQSNRTDEL